MVSLIIPTYKNPKYLDICLKSAIEGQSNKNEIIVAVDGFISESRSVLDKYKDNIKILDLGHNQGMQQALNLGVYNASNETICIINDDNVLSKGWDTTINNDLNKGEVLTINQIEPTGPGIFNFPVKGFGGVDNFDYDGYLKYEQQISKNKSTDDGGIFPFAISKKII